jgi:hypothetical protein
LASGDFWLQLGFRQSPYATDPLPGDEEGENLLVGRESELAALMHAIVFGTGHASIDGPNGVGKTSLVAVSTQRLRRRQLKDDIAARFYPLKRPINVTRGVESSALLQAAYLEIAQSLLRIREDLGPSLSRDKLHQLEEWLNAPQQHTTGGGATVLGFGGSGSRGTSLNTTRGFEASGLPGLVLDILEEQFPTRRSGGLVAVLENIELAGTTQNAQDLLEGIRDPLLMLPGLRWVLCGADGAMRIAAGSLRLDGVIAPPIELRPLQEDHASEVIDRRIRQYQLRPQPIVPVDGAAFAHLFNVARGNLRTAFRYSDQFTEWAYNASLLDADVDSPTEVRTWLVRHAEERLRTIHPPLDDDAWAALDALGQTDDLHVFDPEREARLVRGCETLEQVGLARRATTGGAHAAATLTREGWLIRVVPAQRRI